MTREQAGDLWSQNKLAGNMICAVCNQPYYSYHTYKPDTGAKEDLIVCTQGNGVFTIEQREDRVYKDISTLLTTAGHYYNK